MKNESLLILAGAAAAAFLLLKSRPKAAPSAAAAGAPAEVFGESRNGWRYFTDGTAIAPDGRYYKNGELVYNGGVFENINGLI